MTAPHIAQAGPGQRPAGQEGGVGLRDLASPSRRIRANASQPSVVQPFRHW